MQIGTPATGHHPGQGAFFEIDTSTQIVVVPADVGAPGRAVQAPRGNGRRADDSAEADLPTAAYPEGIFGEEDLAAGRRGCRVDVVVKTFIPPASERNHQLIVAGPVDGITAAAPISFVARRESPAVAAFDFFDKNFRSVPAFDPADVAAVWRQPRPITPFTRRRNGFHRGAGITDEVEAGIPEISRQEKGTGGIDTDQLPAGGRVLADFDHFFAIETTEGVGLHLAAIGDEVFNRVNLLDHRIDDERSKTAVIRRATRQLGFEEADQEALAEFVTHRGEVVVDRHPRFDVLRRADQTDLVNTVANQEVFVGAAVPNLGLETPGIKGADRFPVAIQNFDLGRRQAEEKRSGVFDAVPVGRKNLIRYVKVAVLQGHRERRGIVRNFQLGKAGRIIHAQHQVVIARATRRRPVESKTLPLVARQRRYGGRGQNRAAFADELQLGGERRLIALVEHFDVEMQRIADLGEIRRQGDAAGGKRQIRQGLDVGQNKTFVVLFVELVDLIVRINLGINLAILLRFHVPSGG